LVSTVQRWGNSLAVRIPKALAIEAELGEKTAVDIAVRDGALVVRAAKKQWSLEKMVGAVTPANRHREVDWGDAAGREVW